MGKILILEIIVGDKHIPTIIMFCIFLMSQSGHFTVEVRYCELNLGKHLCLFVVEAWSAGKMYMHAHLARNSGCILQETPQPTSRHYEELFKASLTCTTTT